MTDSGYIYHGPTAPGPGWVEVGKGPMGGRMWQFRHTGQPAIPVEDITEPSEEPVVAEGFEEEEAPEELEQDEFDDYGGEDTTEPIPDSNIVPVNVNGVVTATFAPDAGHELTPQGQERIIEAHLEAATQFEQEGNEELTTAHLILAETHISQLSGGRLPEEADRPPDKPTAEEFAEWLDAGWSYGENGWEPPPQQEGRPAASREVSAEVHQEAAKQLPKNERHLVSYAQEWEASKPWDVTREQMQVSPPPGFALTKQPHGEVAHFQGGIIYLSPKFFDDPTLQDPAAKRHIVYHELGHLLADSMVRDGTSFQLHDAGVIPEKHDLGSGTGGGHGDEEALADVYAILQGTPEDREWLQRHYPDMTRAVIDRAWALGMPLPKETGATSAVKESTKTNKPSSEAHIKLGTRLL